MDEFPIEMTEDLAADRTPQRVKYLVIHCTARPGTVAWDKQDILTFFSQEREWSRPGYRDFIDREGNIINLRPYNSDEYIQYEEATWGARGYNWEAWHVAYDGGVNSTLVPTDNRTDAQRRALRNYVNLIKVMYPHITVLGHRDLPGVHKACPSFDAISEYEESLIDLNDMFDTALDSLD